LEQPIVIDIDDKNNRWGFSDLYIGAGELIDGDYFYKFTDLKQVNMSALYAVFSKSFDDDMVARGTNAGLVVSIYDRA